MSNREVEVKVRVKDFIEIKQKLEVLNFVFEKPVTQEDVIYTNMPDGWPVFNKDRIALRVRSIDGKTFLTYKKAVSNELDKVERELEIDNAEIMQDIIRFLGFAHIATVKKTRIEAHGKDINVCLDDVEDLGKFIEVEKMINKGDGEKVQRELLEFLVSLGVDRKERVSQGYDTLLASLKK